jgi:hypothetical protein
VIEELDAAAPGPDGGTQLAQLNNVKLEEVGKGRLSLSTSRLTFERKSGIFSAPAVELSIPLDSISASEVDEASYTLALQWWSDSGSPSACRLHLPKCETADTLCHSLDGMLETIQREAVIREQHSRYQDFLGTTGCGIWALSRLLSRTVRDLTSEAWDGVDTNLSQALETAEALAAEAPIDASEMVRSLIQTASSRDASLVLSDVSDTIKAVGAALAGEGPRSDEWGDAPDDEDSAGLAWRDMQYLLLFASWHELLPLWQQSGDHMKVGVCLRELSLLSPVLARRTGIVLPPDASSGEDLQDTPSIDAVAEAIDTWLKDYTETD